MMLPSDRALAFSQRVVKKINGALFLCKERYPADAPHSVLFVVVERDASLWTEQLIPLHQELFGAGRSDPLAPVMLEVIDRAADDALRRLEKVGLLTPTSRATLPLFSKEEGLVQESPLSEEEKRKVEGHRAQAARKLKLARLLGEGDFPEEARAPLQAAILELSRALCVERRLAPPAELGDAAYRPGASVWGDALPVLQEFLSNPTACWKKATDVVEQRLKQG